jgi:ribonuclease HI
MKESKKSQRLGFVKHTSIQEILKNRANGRRLQTDQEVRILYDIPLQSDLIYTDGSCFRCGRNPKAGIGVYFGRSENRNISARLPGPNQTSNRAELFAVLKALEVLHLDMILSQGMKLVYILTDSKSVVDVLNRLYPTWTQVKLSDKDGFQRVRDMVMILQDNEIDVQFKHIRGHSGILGNEIADILAKKGAMMPESNDENFDSEAFDLMVEEILESGGDEWDVIADETLIQDDGNEDDDDEGTTSQDASEIEGDSNDDGGSMSDEMYEDKELDEMIREELLYEDEELDTMIADKGVVR